MSIIASNIKFVIGGLLFVLAVKATLFQGQSVGGKHERVCSIIQSS